MKEIRNKTPKPMRIALPQGKVLHLGPHKTGRIHAAALDHPPVKKLLEAEEIEIVGDGTSEASNVAAGDPHVAVSTHGMGQKVAHHKGDR